MRKHQFALKALHVQLGQRLCDNNHFKVRRQRLRNGALGRIAPHESVATRQNLCNDGFVVSIGSNHTNIISDHRAIIASSQQFRRMLAAHFCTIVETNQRKAAVKFHHTAAPSLLVVHVLLFAHIGHLHIGHLLQNIYRDLSSIRW